MADGVKAKFDTASLFEALDKLAGPALHSLARSMAVAGGQVLRDEAKARAPVNDGTLRDAIHLVYKEAQSSGPRVVYTVTWNKKKAPHGHLLEFGHWQSYRVLKLPGGRFVTDKKTPRKEAKWIPAHSFLRPALDAAGATAVQAMIQRGRVRLPQLLAGAGDENKEGS